MIAANICCERVPFFRSLLPRSFSALLQAQNLGVDTSLCIRDFFTYLEDESKKSKAA